MTRRRVLAVGLAWAIGCWAIVTAATGQSSPAQPAIVRSQSGLQMLAPVSTEPRLRIVLPDSATPDSSIEILVPEHVTAVKQGSATAEQLYLFRPGSERYRRENGSFGITTLRKRHVRLASGFAEFSYTGKSSKKQKQRIANEELVRLVARLTRAPGARLFRFQAKDGWRDLDASMLIAYVRRQIGPFAVKDFRTWGGTLRAATVLAELGPGRNATETKRNVALAMRIVASELGNTPTICRASYVHPMILARYVDAGETIAIRHRARTRADADHFAHSPEERALIAFLDKHFPERRRRARHGLARAA